MTLPGSILALAALVVPRPELQVCLARLPTEPCSAVVPVEGTVRAFGISGAAELRWLVDGTVRETVRVDLSDGIPSKNLLLFEPRVSSHALRLVATLDGLGGEAELELSSFPCPFAMDVDSIATSPGRELIIGVLNRGPAPSGAWEIRVLVDGERTYESPMDSLVRGQRYELLLPWNDLMARSRGRRVAALGGRRAIRVTIDLETSANDLVGDRPPFEVLVPMP